MPGSRAARLALGGRKQSRDDTHDLNVRLIKSDPKIGRAEALRRAMLAYMNDATDPLSAYPALWAPFVVVGEGAAR